jgi:hypothetical protein
VVVAGEAQDIGAVGRQIQERAGWIGIDDHVDLGILRGCHLAGGAVDVPLHPCELSVAAGDPNETEARVARTRDRDRGGEGLRGEVGPVERDHQCLEHVTPSTECERDARGKASVALTSAAASSTMMTIEGAAGFRRMTAPRPHHRVA